MPAPPELPIGLALTKAARQVSQAFDAALAQAGGSLPIWLVLLSVKTRHLGTQRELAASVGVGEATLTHHLNAMDAQGLVRRVRDPENRRVQRVELTTAGEQAFLRLRDAAISFDRRLRRGTTSEQLTVVCSALATLATNITD